MLENCETAVQCPFCQLYLGGSPFNKTHLLHFEDGLTIVNAHCTMCSQYLFLHIFILYFYIGRICLFSIIQRYLSLQNLKSFLIGNIYVQQKNLLPLTVLGLPKLGSPPENLRTVLDCLDGANTDEGPENPHIV